MRIEIEESPFGDKGAVYEGQLAFFNHLLLQLKSSRSQKNTPEESAFLEADIAGYEEVLKSNSEENAQAFMMNKRDPVTHRNRFANNSELVKWLKENGKWI